MKIKPIGKNIQLKLETAKAGILDTSSRNSAVEYAEVVKIGEEVKTVKVGDKVFIKSWAVDIVNHRDETYYFVDESTGGIKAIII